VHAHALPQVWFCGLELPRHVAVHSPEPQYTSVPAHDALAAPHLSAHEPSPQ
jgi:hypothetical protein